MGDGKPSITIAIPLDALPSVTVSASPPALVSRVNAAHVGMEPDELLRILRAMRAHPRFRDAVIVHGKRFRAAAPEAIVAYLRAVPARAPADASDDVDDNLLTELGYARR